MQPNKTKAEKIALLKGITVGKVKVSDLSERQCESWICDENTGTCTPCKGIWHNVPEDLKDVVLTWAEFEERQRKAQAGTVQVDFIVIHTA
jgi:hypothetical protein